MSSRPFMPLFCGDFLGDTLELNAGDFGRYMLLCMAYWQKGGPLSDDDRALAQITRSSRYVWQKTRKKLANFFTVIDGKWRHKRVDFELAKIKHRNEIRARNEAPASAASRTRVQSQPDSGEVALTEQLSTEVESSGPKEVRAPPAGRALTPLGARPPGSIFTEAEPLLGKRDVGVVGKMFKEGVGLDRVRYALDLVRRVGPDNPVKFFCAVCRGREARQTPPPETVPPPDNGPSRRLTPEEIDAIYGKQAA